MNFQKNIFIGLLILAIVGAIAITIKFYLDYKKTEKQHKACVDRCSAEHRADWDWNDRNICYLQCGEKYGK